MPDKAEGHSLSVTTLCRKVISLETPFETLTPLPHNTSLEILDVQNADETIHSGGIAAYVAAFGGSATSWYTDETSQAQYHNYIEAIVSRYKTSTAVFSWELANEPRCSGCDTYVPRLEGLGLCFRGAFRNLTHTDV